MLKTEWNGFNSGVWEREVNVRDFIQKNYTPYDGDDTFLVRQHRTQKIYGNRFWIYRNRKEKLAVFWIWTPESSPPSHLMVLDT